MRQSCKAISAISFIRLLTFSSINLLVYAVKFSSVDRSAGLSVNNRYDYMPYNERKDKPKSVDLDQKFDFDMFNAANLGDAAFNVVSNLAENMVNPPFINETQRTLPITSALERIQKNMDVLDNVAGRTPQLTRLEIAILATTVTVSAISPYLLSSSVVEVLVPSMAAVSASIGLSAEYVGKVSVSKGKEIAALAIQAAAEAEVLLAAAERSKAILPLCIGITTTASAFALLAPSILSAISEKLSIQLLTEIFLLCPLIAVLAASIAGLATQEAREYASRATGVGARRFASSNEVGRTWMSATEQVQDSCMRVTDKWKTFAFGVLPAPIIAALCPGALPFKAIVCTAIAAAQAAYYLAIAEYFLASAVEAVALKSRSAAVADTYANQSSRAGAILPFTSALAGLCAAATAAAVELIPMIEMVELQSVIVSFFPAGAAMFAAAASVAKARCEVDALAASYAASKGLAKDGDKRKDPILVVKEQIYITGVTTWTRLYTRYKQARNVVKNGDIMKVVKKWWKKFTFGIFHRKNKDQIVGKVVTDSEIKLQTA